MTSQSLHLEGVATTTGIQAWSGFCYVAFAIDLFSRTLVGWQVSTVKDTAFVESCLKMALWRRDHAGHAVERGMIHHADYAEVHVKPRNRRLVSAGMAP
ncbi:MAG: DDE-type integrase/transposase/recombinase [Acidimicrobiales bacterium]